jgi:hypothetical protein
VKDQLAKVVPLLLRLGAGDGSAPGVVVAVDERGAIRASYHDPEGRHASQVTGAEIHEGHLYLTSIAGDWIARCPLPADAAP